ncbi:hypothetical protein BN000_05544 [Mycobacterium europaeum]|uniref:Reverse transcriptase domain-containing protein n=1 Tax=Mycobacterium europaeum TaxID=761804 RepID=A0A0U1DV32_9MYCO|nr:hypothetical protein [Mycobacterium europaeum]CQD22248.1 hypothetical protein BN000_05544 [Mycobacterium europaeum]
MAFRRIPLNELFDFDLRLFDQHARYEGRWSDEQLKAIVERLGLPPGKNLSCAIASFARSLVLDAKTDNHGIHFSRDRNKYADRYLVDGDPYNTYYFTTKAADWLQAHYGCEQLRGAHVAGRESAEYCSPELMEAIGDLVDPLEPRARPARPELIIVRDAHKKNTRYSDTSETKAMRDRMWIFNDHLAQRDIRRRCQMVEVPLLRRVFNLSFERGGRLYGWGESYQGLPKEQRAEFTEVIDGIVQPFVEIDYPAHHFRLAYAQARKKMPPGDPYDIPGFDRGLVKLACLISFNAQDKKDAVGALMGESGCSYDDAKAVIRAVRRKHYRIREYFYSDIGARLMRTDSDMSVEIMKRVMAITGRCPLPMHDSFLVPACDAEVLAQVMEEFAAEYGVEADLSITGAALGGKENNTSSIPTPYMADQSAELRIFPSAQIASAASPTSIDCPSRPPNGSAGPPSLIDNPTGFALWLRDRNAEDKAAMEHAVMPAHLRRNGARSWGEKYVELAQHAGWIIAEDEISRRNALQAEHEQWIDALRAQDREQNRLLTKAVEEKLALSAARRARQEAKIAALIDAICDYVGAHPGANQTAIVKAMGQQAGVFFFTAEIARCFTDDVRQAIEWAGGRLRREKDGRAYRHYLVTE